MEGTYGAYRLQIPSIFDLGQDDDGVLRMPFNPADYGADNHVERPCHECGDCFPQGAMKELSVGLDTEGAVFGSDKLYSASWFFCRACWFSSEISDAAHWVA